MVWLVEGVVLVICLRFVVFWGGTVAKGPREVLV